MKSPAEYAHIFLSQPSRARFVTSRLLRAGRISHLVTMRIHPRVRLRLYPSALSEAYWMDPSARADDHTFLERFIRPGDTVVDVGANIGALTVQASSLVGGAGRVISIEAHPNTYRFLAGNLRLNRCSNVTALNVAVGAAPGVVTFSDLRSDDENRVSHSGVMVPMDTLDRLLSGIPVSLLKIDVEGYEKFVLEGAVATLRSTACVYFESFDRHFAEYGYQTADVLKLLTDAGFRVLHRDGRGWTAVETGYASRRCENLLALREQAAVAFAQGIEA